MSKFTWGDDVRVLRPTSARDRWGQSASVIGVFEQRPPGSHFDRFPPGTVYAVEFADGEALDLHEDDLAAGSAAGERRSDDGEARLASFERRGHRRSPLTCVRMPTVW